MKKRKRGNSEGSIYQMKDGRWRAAVTIDKDANGRPKRKVFTAATRHEVKDKLTDALKDLKSGIPIVIEKQTLGCFLAHWLDHVITPHKAPKTARTYSDIVRLHITPALGAIAIGKLLPQQIREFLNAKLAAGLSPRTIKHILVTLRGALSMAVKDGQIPRNAAASVELPSTPRPKPKAFTREQARDFLGAVAGSRLEAAFTTAVAIGLRQGEILGLRWEDVDFETAELQVTGALQRVNKKLIRRRTKTESGERTIQLPGVCLIALAKHKAQQDVNRQWAGSRWQERGYVFTTRIGTPMDPRDLLREYYAITRPKLQNGELGKLSFPPIRFHDLRHSVATLLLAQGVSAKYITELLGHTQVSFTMQTYAHTLKEVQRTIATKTDEIFAPDRVATSVATKPVLRKPS